MRVPRTDAGRRRSGWLAVTLGVAGALVGALAGAGPAAAAGTASLTLRPDRGRPTAPFAVQYSFSPESNACPATVDVTWDDQPLGTARVTRAGQRFSSLCVASLNGTPLANDLAAGRHTIGVPAVAGHPAKTASYTVLPGPTPTNTPTAGASDDPNQGAGDPGAGVTTSQASVAPLANAAPAPSVAGESTQSGGGGAMSLILLFGGLLVVGGIIIFGLLIYWTRRGDGGGVEPEPATPGPPPYGTARTTVYGASHAAPGLDDAPASQTRTAVYGTPPADTATRMFPAQDPYGDADGYPARDTYPAQDPYSAEDPRHSAYDPYSFDHGDRQGPGSQHR